MPAKQHMNNPNAKKILIVCDEGNNRSVTIAGQLKYWGHDCICVGLNRNRDTTIAMLCEWADLVILTEQGQVPRLHVVAGITSLGRGKGFSVNCELWDIGPDKYPRSYNPELLRIVKQHIEKHRKELAPAK